MKHLIRLFALLLIFSGARAGDPYGAEYFNALSKAILTNQHAAEHRTYAQVLMSTTNSDGSTKQYGFRSIDGQVQLMYWTDHVIGTGSGNITLNTQAYPAGDRVLVTNGIYSGGTFDNFNNLVILPQNGRPVFTGTVNFHNHKFVEFSGFSFIGVSGDAITMSDATNNVNNSYLHNLSFTDCTDACINSDGNKGWTPGDTTTLTQWKNVYDSLTEIRCPQLYRSSFHASLQSPAQNVHDSVIYSRILVLSPVNNDGPGQEINMQGGFRINVHDVTSFDPSNRDPNGDNGLVYIKGGNANIWNIYKNGGPGYVIRFYLNEETYALRDLNAWNIGKFNGTEYGGASVQFDPNTLVSSQVTGCGFHFYNFTIGNNDERIGYWSPIWVVGGMSAEGQNSTMRNGLAFNLKLNGKNPIIVNQSGAPYGYTTDTSKCKYFASATLAQLDSTTTFYSNISGNFPLWKPMVGSLARNAGESNPFTSVDYLGVSRPANGDIGYLQYQAGANTPPVAVINGPNSVTLPTNSVLLDGSASSDPNGSVTAYLWAFVSGPNTPGNSTPTSNTTTFSGLVSGTYVFSLRVTDNGGLTNTVQKTVVVNTNTPPTAVITGLASITLPTNSVNYSGTGSTDANGTIAGYAWAQNSGPNTAGISAPTASATNFTGLIAGTYVFKLTVTDNQGATGSTTKTLTVNPAPASGRVHILNPGTIDYTGQNIVSGDTILMVHGAWPLVDVSNRSNLVFLNADNQQVQITSFKYGNTNNIQFRRWQHSDTTQYGFLLTGSGENAIDANGGNNINDTWTGFDWGDGFNEVWNSQGNTITFDGNQANTVWWSPTMDSCIFGEKTYVLRGTFEHADSYHNFTVHPTANHLIFRTSTNAGSNGVRFRGFNIWAARGSYWTQVGQTDNTGDAGFVYIETGNGQFDHIYYAGGWGYIERCWVATCGSIPFDQTAWLRYSVKRSGLHYGVADVRGAYDPSNGIPVCTTCTIPINIEDFYYDHNTGINNADGPDRTNGPTSGCHYVTNSLIVGGFINGSGGAKYTIHARDNFSANASYCNPGPTNGSSFWKDNSGGNVTVDSTHNVDLFPGNPFAIGPGGWLVDSLTTIAPQKPGPLIATASDGTDKGAVQSTTNQPPTAVITGSSAIQLPTSSVTLSGTSSSDPNGSIAGYNWSQVSGPNTASNSAANASSTTFGGMVAGTYVFRLLVTDNGGLTASTTKTVVVSPANVPPTAVITGPGTVQMPTNTVALSGTSSTDPDGSIVGYAWSQTSGPNTATISAPTGSTSNFTGLIPGTYVFKLIVTDNQGATGNTSKTVVVSPANQNPLAVITGPSAITLPTNTATFSGTSSSDPDGTVVSYAWTVISGPSTPTNSAPAGSSTVFGNLIQGTYVIQLLVTDNSGGTNSVQKTFTVNPAPQPPISRITGSGTVQLPANSVNLDGSTSSDPDGTIVGYQWSRLSGPNVPTFSSTTTATVTISGLIQGTYVFNLNVTDNSGLTSLSSKTVVVQGLPPANTLIIPRLNGVVPKQGN